MKSYLLHLKQGLNQELPRDAISGKNAAPDFKSNLRNLKPFLVRHWPKAAWGILLILVLTPIGYISPIVYRYFIDVVLLGKNMRLLWWIILLMAALKLFEKIGGIIQNFYFTRFGQKVMLDIQNDLFGRVLRFPKSFFDDKETGYLMSRITNDVQSLQWFFSTTIIYMVTSVIKFITGVALLFYLEWRLALLSLIVMPALIGSIKYFSRKTHVLSHHTMETRANVLRRMQEALSSIPLIKAFTSEENEAGRVKQEMNASYNVSLDQVAVFSLAGLTFSSLADIARLAVIIVGAPMIITGNWSLGSLYAFLLYQSYVFEPAQFFASADMQLQSALAALERVSAFYNVLPEEHKSGNLNIEHLKGEIQFRNMVFSYDGKENVLENISFSIKPGEHVAIVGPSGVGKTTLISLMLGFYWPSRGEILFDSLPFSHYDINALRKRIGYVSQSTRLLSGTIMENLRYGNLGAGEERVIAAAKTAGIHQFIDGLPDKYHSLLGENGVNLSEGQRQRLSIARALVKDPDILILDEPSSSLDSFSEKSIFGNLPRLLLDKTLIIVAHRLSTVKDADRILVFNDKQLVAEGTHQSLSQSNEFYRMLMRPYLEEKVYA
jgi:ABC-type multidrug transport system fused ATPase/permease subunit